MIKGDRDSRRLEFVEKHGWGDANIIPLVPDASFRQYFRLVRLDSSVMLMDAPPEYENVTSFVKITHHLKKIGITAPQLLTVDTDNGFILLEDLGNDTFTALLAGGAEELPLYQIATTTLGDLQNHVNATAIELPEYNRKTFINEACLFTHWYLPGIRNSPIDDALKQGYVRAWHTLFDNLPKIEPTLVLRDYHVDNLMIYNDKCVVLDYQDALIGSPAYDLVSLLEDARRDIPNGLTGNILQQYYDSNPSLDRDIFNHHYQVWGTQRHCKVLGIFTRLWLRDNKPIYLKHLSRVMGLLRKKLQHAALHPLKSWFTENNIDTSHKAFIGTREQLVRLVRSEQK